MSIKLHKIHRNLKAKSHHLSKDLILGDFWNKKAAASLFNEISELIQVLLKIAVQHRIAKGLNDAFAKTRYSGDEKGNEQRDM